MRKYEAHWVEFKRNQVPRTMHAMNSFLFRHFSAENVVSQFHSALHDSSPLRMRALYLQTTSTHEFKMTKQVLLCSGDCWAAFRYVMRFRFKAKKTAKRQSPNDLWLWAQVHEYSAKKSKRSQSILFLLSDGETEKKLPITISITFNTGHGDRSSTKIFFDQMYWECGN